MAMYTKLMAILIAIFAIFFTSSASAQVTEKVFPTFGECWAAKAPYYPTISRPLNNKGSRMTISQIRASFKDGTCVLSSEVVDVVNGKPTLVTGWAFLPGAFEVVQVGQSYYMYLCSNAITAIGPPAGWSPPQPTSVTDQPRSRSEIDTVFTPSQPASLEMSRGISTTSFQGAGGMGNQGGMSTGGKILTGVAIVGGAYLIDRALDRASKPRTTINNNGICAGANFSVNGNNNATCGPVVTTTPTNQTVVCNAPNRLVAGTCTAPPVCQGAAVLDQQSFICQCLSPNRVFMSGLCEVPRQCNLGEVLGTDNVCRSNGPYCRVDQVAVGTQCQCPNGRVEVNGSCQVPVQYCPDGSIRPSNGFCQTPVTCVNGQIPVNGICQCPQGQQFISGICQIPVVCTGGQVSQGNNTCACPLGQQLVNNICQVPVQYCPNGSVRPTNGQCPLICIGGRIDLGGYCGCSQGQVEVNGFCQTPPQCRFDQVLVNNICQCPPGREEFAGVCRIPLPACVGGQVPVNGICQCPQGQQLIGGVCQNTQNNTCPIGEVMFAGVCRIPLPGGG